MEKLYFILFKIEDKYDEAEPSIKKIDSNAFIIQGMLSINDFNDNFNVDIKNENYDTMSGFIIDIIVNG
jgi:putative hemolysin